MPDYEIVEHCAPTLAGMKIGNLFAVYGSYDSVCREIRALNRRLGRFGIRVIPFRRQKDRTLIYLFRPEGLKQYFDHPETKRFLLQKGYPASQPERCVALLAERMRTDEGFPHEVGLFLGYPAKDVEGFIADSRKGASSCGCWKVYGDSKNAEETFQKYKKCTDIYRKQMLRGRTLEQLIV